MKKRLLAGLLSFTLLLSLVPTAAMAETEDNGSETASNGTIAAEEVTGVSRLDEQTVTSSVTHADVDVEPLYDEDELVTVMVQLDAPAVLDYYDMASFAAEDEDATAGENVAQFLSSADAKAAEAELKEEQESVLGAIAALAPATYASESSAAQVTVVGQWTSIVNAMAVRVPYGMLDQIKALDGVTNAYVELTYDRPEEPTTDAGDAGYSYDLVGISEVWGAGYTGKGMLVAVLDTGLDLNWAAYYDNDANVETTGNSHITAVHQAFTTNSFKSDDAKESLRYTSDSLAAFLETVTLNGECLWLTDDDGNTIPGTEITYDYNALYKNEKVPYAYDYADYDVNVYPSDSDHGTHVSGTILGYAESQEGEVLFSGIAPDAQLLAMKVFGESGGAQESSILCALEDAAKLGADVMNLSLGSTNGFAEDDTAANEAYDRLNAAGILFMISAGNEAYSSTYNNYDDSYGLAEDPEISMVGSPSTYSSALSVAAMQNTVEANSYLTWTDAQGEAHQIAYYDPNDVAIRSMFADTENLSINIIPVDGTGTQEDYYNAGFRSYYGYGEKGVEGIALVKRGELTFTEKVNNATNFTWSYYDSSVGSYVTNNPVKLVLIYDNDPESSELLYISVSGAYMTSASLSGADGAALYEAATQAINQGTYVTLTKVDKQDTIIASDEGGQMCSFSSWGATPSLELKPEITAPGGNIWSCLVGSSVASDGTTDSYGMMSGTSMSAPHMTGITALVEQYALSNLATEKQEAADLTDNLMVSTAVPQKDGNGVYYSPRLQGAGLVNAAAAITTPAYISVEGQNVGKIELMDDPDRTGAYTLTFDVCNLTDEALTYEASAVLMRPDTTEAEGGEVLMTTDETVIKTVSLGTVTVPAGGKTTVSQTVTLTAEEKAQLDDLYPNGVYVEGFVILEDPAEENPQIGLPFLGFYGDWTAAPIFDRATWVDDVDDILADSDCTWWPTILGYYDGYNYANLGQNPFDSTAGDTQTKFLQENVTLAPGTGYFQEINDYEIFQLRDAKVIVAEVRNKETGELYYRDYATYQWKTYYDSSYDFPIPASLYGFTDTNWDGTDLNGDVLPSGTQCVYTLTAYGDGDYPMVYNQEAGRYITDVESIVPGENEPTFNGHAMDTTGNVISCDVMVDTQAPTLVNNSVSLYEEDGRVYLTGTFQDDGSIASVEVAPVVTRSPKGRPEYSQTTYVQADDFYVEYIYDADVQEYTFIADVTEYVHNDATGYDFNMYDYTWTGAVYVFGGDYGGNDRAYAVQVKNGDEFNVGNGLVLSQTSALLHPGSEFDLSVVDNTGDEAAITRTSSNPEVATVDEYGHVVALTAGQTIITVSNGISSAICVVAVEETPTEVLDFNLSIASFDGLKPEGSLVVQVTDLYPADVELTSCSWEVFEDDEDWAGLLTCSKYTSDGLEGEIYLTYSTYDQYLQGEELIPGGTATLRVTLNGVSREMTFSYEDLYQTKTDEDIVADSSIDGEQIIYVTQGETATLIGKYNNSSAHSVCDVALYTAENYVQYGSSNPTTEATGLVLDGQTYCGISDSWSGKLVNAEGYALPETIHVVYRYDYGYEYELTNSWRTDYTYDSTTGEINVYYTPSTETCQLVIRADGVVSQGNPAGALSGVIYTKPDGLYGPFNWELVSGSGELTVFENETLSGYTKKNGAYFTPSEPGVSYVTATSLDGNYSMNMAVVSLPVKADTLTLDANSVTLTEGESTTVGSTLSPEPSLEKDQELIWTSFDPSVATVSEDGTITAVAPGYAFLKVCTKADTTVQSYLVVKVEEKEEEELPEESTKPEETQPTESTKPEETQPTESTKPEETKPAESAKPEETKPAESTKPEETKPAESTKPEETQPAESTKPEETKPAESTKPEETKPAESTKPEETKPAESAKPEETKPAESAKPEETKPVETTPVEDEVVCDGGVSCPSYAFYDVSESDWFHLFVDFAVTRHLMEGYGDGVFAPNDNLTRAMLVQILYAEAGKPAVTSANPFTDVEEGKWYTDAIIWAYENGVVAGYGDGTFGPNDNITREQLAVILWSALGKEEPAQQQLSFTDADQAHDWALSALLWANENGIMNGNGDGTINPLGLATRAEAACMLKAYLSIAE